MADNQDTIIIRRAAESPRLTVDQQCFLKDVAVALEGGNKVDLFTRWQVTRLICKAVFG